MHIHELGGCAPQPLAYYLKALGVLRILGEQGDSLARGWWEEDRFFIATVLDKEELLAFFLERYAPTPIFNPWGGRSGYFEGSSESSARASLKVIESSTDSRLEPFREVIKEIRRNLTQEVAGAKPIDDDKLRLIESLLGNVRGQGRTWLNVVLSLNSDQEFRPRPLFPPLVGTGGNEGSGSYTSGYMSGVIACIIERQYDAALASSIFDIRVPNCESKLTLGQFKPEGRSNPWDLLLAIEGAQFFITTAASKRVAMSRIGTSAPFTVRPIACGYPNAARIDEFTVTNGKELPGRGEQWFPLWTRPALTIELLQLIQEGRCSNGRIAVGDGWSMARAVGTLGIRRGIGSFVRYGYLQRNNQSLHYAVPLGRFQVAESPAESLECFNDIDTWFASLRFRARERDASIRLRASAKSLGDAMFAAIQRPQDPRSWQEVLSALVGVEFVLRNGGGDSVRPIPPLRPEWARAADDGSPELRLALAFALQATEATTSTGKVIDGLRRHWLPLDPEHPGNFATTGEDRAKRLLRLPEVVMQGRDPIADAVAMLERRLVEAASGELRNLSLRPAVGATAHPSDLAAWMAGTVDTDRTLRLARALLALDRRQWARRRLSIAGPADSGAQPDDAWIVLRVAYSAWPLPDGMHIACDPAILRRLASGDAASAVALALQRLRSHGLRCSVRTAAATPEAARLWAAALAFPIDSETSTRLALRLDPAFFNPMEASAS